MAKRLPRDFDADAYAAAYPDVALSGLDAREHYRRFGRLLKRNPNGRPVPAAAAPSSNAGVAAGSAQPVATEARATLIDRPAGFDPQDVVRAEVPPRETDPAGFIALDVLAAGASGATDDGDPITAPLEAYAKLMRLGPLAGATAEAGADPIGSSLFTGGTVRLENAWYPDQSRIRLMFAGAADPEQALVLRAYQASPETPGKLREAGAGADLSSAGPIFHDIELVHPLMPLILEVSDRAGVPRGVTLLPFPSLLPGGLHGAELRAFQSKPNPLESFWHLSAVLLGECLATGDAGPRSIAEVAVADGSSGGRYLIAELESWLKAVFEISLHHGGQGAGEGLRLSLPANAYPTITALVSRRLEQFGSGRKVGPFLVVDPNGLTPTWSVTLPDDQEAENLVPFLEGQGSTSSAQGTEAVPVHLAIVQRPATLPPAELLPAKGLDGSQDWSGTLPKVSILMDASDPIATEELVQRLSGLCTNGFELFVRSGRRSEEIRRMLDDGPAAAGWRAVEPHVDVREVAAQAGNGVLLTISDRIALDDGRTIARLCELLQGKAVASASCVLLGEHQIKKKVVLRPASGGLFPSRVSFLSSPRLGFAEPDVLQPLDGLTYAVAANTFLLTAWNKDALAALQPSSASAADGAADIRLGLDLMAAGYRNLCTAALKATLRAPYVPRDAIDPVGSAYLQPGRWEDVLRRVTLLRELV